MLPARDRRPPLPHPPPPTGLATTAEPHILDDGRLVFRAPAGAYAGLPAWHSRGAWLGAVRLHPGLPDACHARAISVDLCLQVLHELTRYGDHTTGRDIAVSHDTVAAAIGRSSKTVQRACRAAESLGVLRRVLTGTDMSLPQRIAVLGHYSRGTPGHRWRALPNFYAALMPPSLAALAHAARPAAKPARGASHAGTVDNHRPSPPAVHLPEGSRPPQRPADPLNLRTTPFEPPCAQPPTPRPVPAPTHPAATRPRTARSTGRGRRPRALDPHVEHFARTYRDQLPGYRTLSLHRIGNALARYAHAGLTPDQLTTGVNAYLTANRITWITHWHPDDQETQARYLIGTIRTAERHGHLPPTNTQPCPDEPIITGRNPPCGPQR